MKNRIQILCTRPLNKVLKEEAKLAGLDIEELSFIITEPIQSVDVQQETELALQESVTVVFTSMNAVEAVAFYQEEAEPDWSIYCIGNTTKNLAGKYFGEDSIAGAADDAASLADLIVEEGATDAVIFFCGDQRREELPNILRDNAIEVNEIIVYQTIAAPHKLDKVYHGIVFFSPSAVNAFFKNNKLPDTTILFAIGSTTAKEIKKFSNNKIIISDEPGKENLVKKMMEYFT